jgi:hypothetical protein
MPLLGTYTNESKSAYNRDTCTSMSIPALFTIAKLSYRISLSTDKLVKKIYIHNRVLFNHKENDIMSFARKMNRTGEHHVKVK